MTESHTFPIETGLTPDVTKRKLYAEFFEMLKATGFLNTSKTNGITLDNMLSGYGLLAFSLRRTHIDQQEVISMPVSGSLRAHIELKAGLALITNFIWLFVSFYFNIFRNMV